MRLMPVRVEGNAEVSREELAPVLAPLERLRFSIPTIAEPWTKDALERTMAEVTAFYEDRGYLNASVYGGEVLPSRDGRSVEVSIKINEGPRFRVGEVSVEELPPGATEATAAPELRALIPLTKGEWVSRTAVLRGEQALVEKRLARGFDEAMLKTSVDGEVLSMRFVLNRSVRPVMRIKSVDVEGVAKADEGAVRAAVGWRGGERWSDLMEREARRRVVALPFVAAAEVSFVWPAQGTEGNVVVRVIAASQPVWE